MRKEKKSSQASWKIIRMQFFIQFSFFISFAEIVSRNYLVSYGNFISDCDELSQFDNRRSSVSALSRSRVIKSSHPRSSWIVRNFAIASTGAFIRALVHPGGRGGGLKHARREKPTGNNHRDESQGASVSNSRAILRVLRPKAQHRCAVGAYACSLYANLSFAFNPLTPISWQRPRCDSPIIRVTRTLARGRQIIP